MAQIVIIVYTPDSRDYTRPADRYARTPIESAKLIAGSGIEGDRKGRFENRQINLMAVERVEALASEGFKTRPGELGEQIVVRGIDVDQLNPGDRVRLGESAILEVHQPRTGCDRFEHIQGKPKSLTRGRLGQMMRVIEGGEIHVADSVAVIEPQKNTDKRR